jgi:beta-lactamase superfamily II metal-dependent hydrolase
MLGAYAVLFALRLAAPRGGWAQRLTGWARIDLVARIGAPALLTALTVGGALIWAAVAALPDGRLHVWFLDIGQGDGILIQTPSGSPRADRRRRQSPGTL